MKLQLPTTTAPDNSNTSSTQYKTPGELYDEVMDGYIKELQVAYEKGAEELREKFLDLALGRPDSNADPSKPPPLALDDLSLRNYMLRSVEEGGKGAAWPVVGSSYNALAALICKLWCNSIMNANTLPHQCLVYGTGMTAAVYICCKRGLLSTVSGMLLKRLLHLSLKVIPLSLSLDLLVLA